MRKQVSLRIDPDILAWFKSPGPGYRERINAALRAFVEAQRRRSASDAGSRLRRRPPWLKLIAPLREP